MSNFSALADRLEQPTFPGLCEAMAPWTSFADAGIANDCASDAVVSAAVLTSTAFRMRDEGALLSALRHLANAVAQMESAHANDND
ncbi:MAG TPA: hypothetical protein VHL31_00505 [Geminicoccus sp.]|jgi:hypothetical protein|uniref:hypothetical protein n=1 Tax=Geminicoccus sp. TaxID=2024832 RepID=UPI002E35A21B|nr:hypothetical protein [Geminicoccus sp.]HEX2524773.1 hypothetical protein [Geminicoccus sp.]